MRILFLSPIQTTAFDLLAWLILHLGISYLMYKMPIGFFRKNTLKRLPFEKSDRFYEKYFIIKKWKPWLPDGSGLFKKGFRKKHLKATGKEFLETFIIETRRAEWTHWLCLLPAPLFFLWNDGTGGMFMILYALLANLPCIIAQRYNRFRFERIVLRMK